MPGVCRIMTSEPSDREIICSYCNSPMSRWEIAGGGCRDCIQEVERIEAMSVNTPVMGSVPPTPERLLDRDDNVIQPGLLYRHFSQPTVWRCTENDGGQASMELIWGLTNYGGEDIGTTVKLTAYFSRSFQCCDPAWLGREFMELRNFLVGEFSYEEAPSGEEVQELRQELQSG